MRLLILLLVGCQTPAPASDRATPLAQQQEETPGQLNCAEPKIIIEKDPPMNMGDRQTLAKAKIRCGQLYPNSPCVDTFIKYADLRYGVICGVKGE